MSEIDRAELLERFKDMTGTTDEFAISFLESTEWKLDPAIELFLGGQGGMARTFSDDESDIEDVSPRGGGGAVGASADMDANEIMRIMEQHGVDYDTALAIKEAGGSASQGGSAAAAGAPDAEGVRAPILQKRARLFDTVEQEEGMLGYMGGGMPTAFDAHMRIAREAMMHGAGASMQAPRPSNFEPPHWMMFAGSFEEARNEAKSKKRWILVNIQDKPEFQSLVLNRDLWSDESVQSLIRESFVFWQQDRTSMEAQRFMTLYNPSPPFPHVCIIDPRTGERVRVLKLKKHEQELRDFFFDQVSDYLDTSALDPGARRQVPAKAPAAASSSSSSSRSAAATTTTSSGGDSEEKALAAAIEASLQVSGQAKTSSSNVDNAAKKAAAPDSAKAAVTMPAPPALEAEPPNGEATTLIQFKFPDGSRLRRRFNKANAVGMLFAFVASTDKLAKSAQFDLTTSEVPARALLPQFGQTLVEADVCQQNLLVRLLD